MIRFAQITLIAVAVCAALGGTASAAPPASGTVTLDGTQWKIADAVAFVDDDYLEVAVSNQAFDRKAFAKDSKIDDFDLMSHADGEIDVFTIKIGTDGALVGYGVQTDSSGGGGSNSEMSDGFTLSSRTADRIAGKLVFASDDLSVDLAFDLPITTQLERAGQKLAAGGGEIGKALLAHFEAMGSGDKEKLLSTAPPDRREQQRAAMNDPDAAQMLAFLAASAPKQVKVTGGVVDGDSAVLDFTGVSEGQRVRGTIEGTQIGGRWYFNNASTSNE